MSLMNRELDAVLMICVSLESVSFGVSKRDVRRLCSCIMNASKLATRKRTSLLASRIKAGARDHFCQRVRVS